MSSLHDLLEQGIYSTEKFLERSQVLADKIASAEGNLAKLKDKLREEKARDESKTNIIPNVERVLEVYSSTDDPKFKNDLLKEVLEKVVYTKTQRAQRGHLENLDNFDLAIYPKLPK